MPLTVFNCKGIPAVRREHIEAAVEAAGPRLAQPYEAWIAADALRSGIRVLITGPLGFERTVTFPLDEAPATITQRVRETIDAPVAVAGTGAPRPEKSRLAAAS
jgi:hypothetical protein